LENSGIETLLDDMNWEGEIRDQLKVKRSRYGPGVAQRVGRGIALLFHECGTRRG